MKKLLFSIILLSFVCISNVYSQDDGSMQAWMNYMTPGDVHKMLAKSEGKWNTTSKFWMMPGTEPSVSKGTSELKMVLGGRYLMSNDKMDVMGMPMEGIGYTGYDNALKVFQQSWMDNMGTGMAFFTGTWDEATKTINYTGTMTDPMTNSVSNVRQTMTVGDDKMLMKMFGKGPDGNEFQMMEIEFVRAK